MSDSAHDGFTLPVEWTISTIGVSIAACVFLAFLLLHFVRFIFQNAEKWKVIDKRIWVTTIFILTLEVATTIINGGFKSSLFGWSEDLFCNSIWCHYIILGSFATYMLQKMLIGWLFSWRLQITFHMSSYGMLLTFDIQHLTFNVLSNKNHSCFVTSQQNVAKLELFTLLLCVCFVLCSLLFVGSVVKHVLLVLLVICTCNVIIFVYYNQQKQQQQKL